MTDEEIISIFKNLDRSVDRDYMAMYFDYTGAIVSSVHNEKELKKFKEVRNEYVFNYDTTFDFVNDALENIDFNSLNKDVAVESVSKDEILSIYKKMDEEIFFKFDSIRDHVSDTLNEKYKKPNHVPLEEVIISESEKENFEENFKQHNFENEYTRIYIADWLYKIPEKFEKDYQFALEAVKKYGRAIFSYIGEKKFNEEIVLEAIKNDCSVLESFYDPNNPKEIFKNKKIAMEAVKKDVDYLKYFHKSLKNDPDILAIVNKNK